MTRRRPIALLVGGLLTATVLSGCGSDELTFDSNWPATDVVTVVRHGDQLALVGIDPTTGMAHALAPIPDVVPGADKLPEAAVLGTSAGTFITVTSGGDSGFLLRVDVPEHKLVPVGPLASARLPITGQGEVTAVAGTVGAFTRQGFAITTAAPGRSASLPAVPMFSDGHCLVGVTGTGANIRTVLIGPEDPFAAPRDLAAGTPGGVACAGGTSVVTLSALASTSQPPPAADKLLVTEADGKSKEITVGSSPRMVTVDDSGTLAALVADGPHGHEVQLVDVRTGQVTSSTDLPPELQPDAISVRGDRVLVIGGTTGMSTTLTGSATAKITLPGDNVTYVWR